MCVRHSARRPCPRQQLALFLDSRNAQRARAARRSSIKSRSTSQNLSEESSSLSISSVSADSLPSITSGRHGSERLLDCRDLRLDFDIRQRLRPRRAAPINIPPSSILSVGYYASQCGGGSEKSFGSSCSHLLSELNRRIAQTARTIRHDGHAKSETSERAFASVLG
jgi:hypothetical protein